MSFALSLIESFSGSLSVILKWTYSYITDFFTRYPILFSMARSKTQAHEPMMRKNIEHANVIEDAD